MLEYKPTTTHFGPIPTLPKPPWAIQWELIDEERYAFLMSLLLNQGMIGIGRIDMTRPYGTDGGFDEQFMYTSLEAATLAFNEWLASNDREPANWTRHKPSDRRRPIDPANPLKTLADQEYVRS